MAYSETYLNNEGYRAYMQNKAASIINAIVVFEGLFNADGSEKLTPAQKDQYIGTEAASQAAVTDAGITWDVYNSDLYEELKNQKVAKNWPHHDTRTEQGKTALITSIAEWEKTKNG